MGATAIGEVLGVTSKDRDFYRNKAGQTPSTSIEATPVLPKKKEDPIPPKAIDDLIDNKMYRRKFNFLIRKGHLQDLLDLAEVARGKDSPSHWFAKVTRTTPVEGEEGKPTRWERALKFLAKLRLVRRVVPEITGRLKVPGGSMDAVFKAAWRHGEMAINMAITAAETGNRHPFGLFCTLALKRADSPAVA